MELDWGQHSTNQKLPRWIYHYMQGTLRVWITRAWPPYAHKHGWLFIKSTKTSSPDPGNQDGTQWVRQHYGSAPLVPSEKPVIKTVQSYPTQSKKRKHIHDTHCITLKRISIAWQPLGWSWSNTPLSPLQCAWSWWTWLGSNHEEQNIFSDQVPWRRVLHKALTVKGIRFVPTPEYIHPMDFAC